MDKDHVKSDKISGNHTTFRNEGYAIHFDKREVNELTVRTRAANRERR